MKECAICGEMLEDHELRCSKGHSRFVAPRGISTFSAEAVLIAQMLRQSPVGYEEDEIDLLVGEILRICRSSHTPVTKDLIETIARGIEAEQNKRKIALEKQRSEAERQRREAELRRRQWANERMETDRLKQEFVQTMERSMPTFRGINNSGIHEDDLVAQLADALNTSVYRHHQVPVGDPGPYYNYVSNDGNRLFWKDVLGDKWRQGASVRFQHFHLLEWLPSAPGRYFTGAAEAARLRASRYVHSSQMEYLPLGKEEMVLGGVGSIRLGVKYLGNRAVYPLCLSSNGISHQGVPAFFSEDQYAYVADFVKHGGCLADVEGQLQIYPTATLPISYDQQIPRFCIFVRTVRGT